MEREEEEVGEEVRDENGKKEEEKVKDLEKGEVGLEEKMVHEKKNEEEFQMNMMQRLNPTNPLRVLVNNSARVATNSARVATPSPSQFSQRSTQPRSTPTPQVSFDFYFLKAGLQINLSYAKNLTSKLLINVYI